MYRIRENSVAFIARPVFKKVLFSAESAGRREFVYEVLQHYGIRPTQTNSWGDFISNQTSRIFITESPLHSGITLESAGIVNFLLCFLTNFMPMVGTQSM